MAYKTYIVDGRQFRTEQDYKDAMYDKELIEKLRKGTADFDVSQLKWFLERVQKGEFHFRTLLGQDFEDEISGRIQKLEKEKAKPKTPGKGEQSPAGIGAAQKKRTESSQGQGAAGSKAERSSAGANAGTSGAARPSTGSTGNSAGASRAARPSTGNSAGVSRASRPSSEKSAGVSRAPRPLPGEKLPEQNPGLTADAKKTGTGRSFSGYTKQQEEAIREAVRRELEKREKRRKFFLLLSGILAAAFLGIFGFYAYQERRTAAQNERLGEMIGTPSGNKDRLSGPGMGPSVTLDGEREAPEVLEEYKTIYNQHKKLIGWLKFDDIDIGGKYGFPVMQTGDNEFFLSHDIEMKEDQNGTIFMDTNCDVLEPSDNFILYGHHMKSGAMFGNLDHYAREEYWKKYPYLEFDTIYEKGTYQVMYVFRSHVYSEEEIAFKYYQFIDAISEREFDSYMEEMAEMSLYDTGVTAVYGDQLLTLSTCDYQEADGRFVVVAKKVPGREE